MIFKQWDHQKDEFENHWDTIGRAMLWAMRSGKTKTGLDKTCRRYIESGLRGLIVTAPNGVHLNWILKQAPAHIWKEVPYIGGAWISSKSSNKQFKRDFEKILDFKGLKILTVNPEALRLERCQKYIKEFLKVCRRDRTGFIGDESHMYRRPGAIQTGLARGLAWQCKWREIMSGTALLNSPLHAYSQFDLLARMALGFETHKDFKDEYAVYIMKEATNGRWFPKLNRYKNLEDLRETLSYWSSVVTRDSIKGMPPLLETERPVLLSKKQRNAYQEMVDELIIEVAGTRVEALAGKGRILKLQQILGGFIIDSRTDEVHSIDDEPPRLEAMLEEVQGTLPGKTIIWCQFTEDIKRVMAYLKTHGIKAVEFHGKVSQGQRQRALKLFEDDPSYTSFVGQSAAGGEGYEITGDDSVEAVIFYSHSDNAITRNQAKERATKIGGKTISLVDLYTPGSVDVPIRNCVAKNISIAEMVSGRGLEEILMQTDI